MTAHSHKIRLWLKTPSGRDQPVDYSVTKTTENSLLLDCDIHGSQKAHQAQSSQISVKSKFSCSHSSDVSNIYFACATLFLNFVNEFTVRLLIVIKSWPFLYYIPMFHKLYFDKASIIDFLFFISIFCMRKTIFAHCTNRKRFATQRRWVQCCDVQMII